MNSPNFASILDRPADTIKPPSAYPNGTYLCIIPAPHTEGTAKTGTPYHEYSYKIIQPQGDVDTAALAEITDGIQGKVIKGLSTRFYTSDDAVWRLVDFLENTLGIEKPGKSIREMEAEAPGKQLYVTLKQVPSQDGTRMYHEVAGVAKV